MDLGAVSVVNLLALIWISPNENKIDSNQRLIQENKILDRTIAYRTGYDSEVPDQYPKVIMPFLAIDHVQEIDEEHQTIVLHGGLLLTWTDSRIGWNISEYAGLREVVKPRSYIPRLWMPKLYMTELFYKTEDILSYRMSQIDVCMTYNGEIKVKLNVLIKASCLFKYDDYPRDIQNCSFTMYFPQSYDRYRFANVSMMMMYNDPDTNDGKLKFDDFILEGSESKALYLLQGSKTTTEPEKYNPKLVRSVYYFDLLFRRQHHTYDLTVALPLFTLSLLVYIVAVNTTQASLVYMLALITCQLINSMNLAEDLPPNYVALPPAARLAISLFVESLLFGLYRLSMLLAVQRNPTSKKVYDVQRICEYLLRIICIILAVYSYRMLYY